MPWKFHGSVNELKHLLLKLGIKGKWKEHLNTHTTQIQFECDNGQFLNFYWGTGTVLFQGYRREECSEDIVKLVKCYLTYESKDGSEALNSFDINNHHTDLISELCLEDCALSDSDKECLGSERFTDEY